MVAQRVPAEIMEDDALRTAVGALPKNYNFEMYKVVWAVRQGGYKRVALQFPEGLQMYALVIADIVEEFTGADVVVMGDVVYGACCVDDYTAKTLGCDFIVHYGHSCLVPVTTMKVKSMYVFVSIRFDEEHLISTIRENFAEGSRLVLTSTVQFVTALDRVREGLCDRYEVMVPWEKPLSRGEVLGCTAAKIPDWERYDAMVFVGDGRFHLEAMMISNPGLTAYLYNTYSKEMTREEYDHSGMMHSRHEAVRATMGARKVGLILGTLGRQGSIKVLQYTIGLLDLKSIAHCIILLSELSPEKLEKFSGIDVWIQTSCPRLSIDWGGTYTIPVITPFEAAVALRASEWRDVYPMDYYSKNSLGPWTPLHEQ